MQLPIHDCTQGRLLDVLAASFPDREALIHPERDVRLTFADLHHRSTRLAAGLLALGVEAGHRVTLWSDNRPDWIPLQFALARIGAILVTANTALKAREMEYLLGQSRSSVVITAPGLLDREYYEALTGLAERPGVLPELRHRITFDDPAPPGFVSLEDVVEGGAAVEPSRVAALSERVSVEDATNIQYTSGTTGFPKGVVLSHRNIVENAYAISSCIGLRPEDRLLLQVPLFHCFGCVISVLGAYTHGATVVALDRYDAGRAMAAIQSERCTIVHGVPTMFLGILDHERFREYDLSSLRGGIMAGSMCPEPLMRQVIERMGCRAMLVAYGLTEASPGVTCSDPDDPLEIRCGTVGRALPGLEVQVVDPETGEPRDAETEGELWVRGAGVMQGYFENPDATAQAITREGWLRTGDLATLDDAGLVRIVGRLKDMIIRGGENVYPAEVEDALRNHESVQDAAVFGVPSERWGEEVVAAVRWREGHAHDDAALLAHLDEHLAHFKVPTRLHSVAELPLTPSGKVQKYVLRERFLTDSSR